MRRIITRTWTEADLPDLSGRRVLVTGANSGIGKEAAAMLAGAGAQVLLGARDLAKGRAAADEIQERHPRAALDLLELDLADLGSVAAAAKRVEELDVLVNNAGVMATPYRQTLDGFELQFGTNHLGHFALTGLLFDRLVAAAEAGRAPRVVTVSSFVHRGGSINFADLQSERSYQRWRAYSQSKLANLLFTTELDRRVRRAGIHLLATAAHPGYAATNLQLVGPRMAGSRLGEWTSRLANLVLGQDAHAGAWPTAYAAAATDVHGGDYIGPGGIAEIRGHPKKVGMARQARDEAVAGRLWAVSEELTGVRYEALVEAAG